MQQVFLEQWTGDEGLYVYLLFYVFIMLNKPTTKVARYGVAQLVILMALALVFTTSGNHHLSYY